MDPHATDEEIQTAFRPTTRAVFGETIANPALAVFDIGRFARVAHANGVPLIVDNTFPTAVLCRPFDFGADIVVYSTSKYLDGHAVSLGGMIVDSGRFDWRAGGKFPGLTEPDPSYHGVVYADAFGPSAFIVKARVQLMRDLGAAPSPTNAFLLNLGMETLHLRMKAQSEAALAVARWLEAHPAVARVHYPGLPSHPQHALFKRDFTGSCSLFGIVFDKRYSEEDVFGFIDSLALFGIGASWGGYESLALPTTGFITRTATSDDLGGFTVRIHIGLEDVGDLIADLAQGLATLPK